MGMTRLLSALRITGKALATVSVLAMVTASGAQAWSQTPAEPPQTLAPESAPPSPVDAEMGESVAAVVNDDIISSYDLVQRMRLLILTLRIQPTQENLPQIQQQALRSLVEERLKIQELRRVEKENKTTIIYTDKELDEELAQTIQGQFRMTPDQFFGQLATQGVGRATYREQARAEMSWQQYMGGRYGSRLRIGHDQIKAYQTRLAEAAAKPQFEVSEIYIDAARVGGMQVATQGAQQLVDQMQQGAPFDQVARQFSAAPTAAAGGDAGWISPGEMPPEVDAVLEQLRPGQLSRPIPTQEGVYIIYLRDKRAGASASMVNLKQAAIAVPEGADQATYDTAVRGLEQLRALAPNCQTLEAKAAQVPNVIAGDMGEAELSTLAPGFADAARNTAEGVLSATPIRTAVGVHLAMVCGKRSSGADNVTEQQIENRLKGQQLDLISKRVMRDLRTTATIEVK
jgi:peptidyl-prolyl cis-trans isomerase SurA